MMIISDKDLHVSLTNGGACRLKAGIPRDLPDLLALEALRKGARQGGEPKTADPEPKPELNSGTPPAPAEEPEELEQEVVEESDDLSAVMTKIIERANPDDLRADGTPKATVVNKLAGRSVEVDEREEAWAEALTKED